MALIAGAYNSSWIILTSIDYITISSTGNAGSFGNLNRQTTNFDGTGNETRALFIGGEGASAWSNIDYTTVSSSGSCVSFGNMSTARSGTSATADGTRAVYNYSGVLEYVTIASTGNGNSFGSFNSGGNSGYKSANSGA
jgi:hypothetical protein